MTTDLWRPSATIEALRHRAALLAEIRQFFTQRQVLETEVPVLSRRATSDPHIESIPVQCGGDSAYLATSPEFGLKRLLAAGLGDCYYLGKAFRQGEAGSRHNPEFTMLEWYRCSWDDRRLMKEVADLLSGILKIQQVQSLSYRDLFQRELQLDPHSASDSDLLRCVEKEIDLAFSPADRSECLDLLMSHRLEPTMGEGITLLYDFPADQAALAKVLPDDSGTPVARRFEAYVGGLELANGYWELTDSAEQLRRFQADHTYRQKHGLNLYPYEERLVEALRMGMPECAGVALGIDRLLMLAGGYKTIEEVIAFPIERA
ncbi:EF-P lysine aminoacylase EpmA [Microbulbifer sp. THAF38]|uniref:EF-P lysine aminoacylase EpmA n=1 Tax=Microbulbifer sp. THAF38 TaxID=2587856 RepID=UPI001267EE06|nr:EF-P lysine aminoacylase EpmA [Microbulbifer sp. THAF38]QFT53261.1 Elongation factor P--(R)-beta-lysine ligase [Microbulbifer sp. THAF38]